MNPVPPPPAREDLPCGWRNALRRALADPALARFDDDPTVAQAEADWAAYTVAVALGRCRLFGAHLGEDDGSLGPAMGRAAARKWDAFLKEWTQAANEIPRHFHEADGAMELLDVALDPLVRRMDSWAAFVAIDEAYEEAQESAWPDRGEFGAQLDSCLEGLDRFDAALKEHIEYLAVASRTALLDNWRKMLTQEYTASLPWWLGGTLERLDEQIAAGATAWQPRRLPARRDELPLDFSSDPEVVRLVAEAHRLAWGHQANPGFAIETSIIEPLPHQRIAVYQHLMPQTRLRFLLADDAGAGKTIMAGLYVREMLSRRLLRRVLVVPPAGLVGNWQSELSKLFDLPFRIVEGKDARASNPFVGEVSDRVIVSVDTLAGRAMFARLAEPKVEPYDLVIFDEAHKLSASRNESDLSVTKTARYRLAEALSGASVASDEDAERWSLGWSCRHVLLLTATPHMGKDYPYYCLWRLLEPEALAAYEAFQRYPQEARRRHFLRRIKEEMVYFDGRRIYPERISDTFSYDLTAGEGGEQHLYDLTTEYLRNQYSRAARLNRSAVRLAMSIFQRRLASSTYALLRSFERRLARLEEMISDLQKDKASQEQIEHRQLRLDAESEDVLDATTADEEEIPTRGREWEENELKQDEALGGVAAWSVRELEEERQQVEVLLGMARRVDDRGDQAKFDRLAELLRDARYRGEKVLIFTEFRDTLEFLVRRLGGLGYTDQVATLHGGMDYRQRQEQVEFFRRDEAKGGARFLVATDAAGEGINLQFCWLLVNYDIPWNPARLEQRMGRVHRFGQKKNRVLIFNLVAGNTREGRVVETLLKKLERIREALHSDKVFDVVGRLLEGVSLRDYMERVLLGEEDAVLGEVAVRLSDERVVRLREEERSIYAGNGDVARHLPEQIKEQEREKWLRQLPGFVRRFVQHAAPRLGLRVEGDLDGYFRLLGDEDSDSLHAAFARRSLTLNRPGQANGHVFLRPGEPLFERLRSAFCDRFEEQARQGAVFVDPSASQPYLFHLARLTVRRRVDERVPAFHREERLESRLVAFAQEETNGGWGEVRLCALERLLVLQGVEALDIRLPESDGRERAAAALRRLADELVTDRRRGLTQSLADRLAFVQRGYDYQVSELSERRVKLNQKVQRGDPAAAAMLDRVRQQQRSLTDLRNAALAAIRAEPDLVEVGELTFLAHAWVVPAPPAGLTHREFQTELIAMRVARAYEEATGAVVFDVSRPDGARAAGLGDHPGFDLLSRRREGEFAIEVKGRDGSGGVELSANEWAQACNQRERYWLYAVLDCGTPFPRLLRIQDPFGKLIARARGVRLDERQLLDAAEREAFGGGAAGAGGFTGGRW